MDRNTSKKYAEWLHQQEEIIQEKDVKPEAENPIPPPDPFDFDINPAKEVPLAEPKEVPRPYSYKVKIPTRNGLSDWDSPLSSLRSGQAHTVTAGTSSSLSATQKTKMLAQYNGLTPGALGKLKSLKHSSIGNGSKRILATLPYGQVMQLHGGATVVVNFVTLEGEWQEIIHSADFELMPDLNTGTYLNKAHAHLKEIKLEMEKKVDETMAKLKGTFSLVTTTYRDNNHLLRPAPPIPIYGACISTGVRLDKDRFMEYRSLGPDELDNIFSEEIENGDYVIYLPVDWVGICGYSEEDVVSWHEFLSKFSMEVPLEYTGITGFPKHQMYPDRKRLMSLCINGADLEEGVGGGVLINDQYYRFILHGCECGMINLMMFKALTLLHNGRGYALPGLALQIKEALGAEISHWQAFLMALIADSYEIFYIGASTSQPRIPEVFASENKEEYVASRLTQNSRMQRAIITSSLTYDKKKAYIELLKKQEFETLFHKLNTRKHEKSK